MAERQIQFNLDWESFHTALSTLHSSYPNCFSLQHEFKTQGVSLSQSLLIWSGESGQTWLLADFDSKKAYDIEQGNDEAGNQIVEVSEQSSEAEQPINLMDTEAILSRLQSVYGGTDQGFIDLLKRINLDEIDLEGLKRSNLSDAGFSFESVHQDLLTVHNMLGEILTSLRESSLNFSRAAIQNLRNHLPKFYENVQQIKDFEISGENPKEAHINLLQSISDSCGNAKEPLGSIIAYFSSRRVEQLAAEINDTVTAAADKLETETNRAEKINNEIEQKQVEREQEFDRLKLEVQNQLTEKPISQYKAIFADQAKKYHKEAQNWLWIAIGTTAVFFGAFYLLPTLLESGGPGWTGILQNLFAKGFLLSPIYLWLNRSIKNYAAQKHLEVINTHRQNALETFDTFVAAAEGNRETRDAILLSATEAIFDANQTGYLSTKTSASESRSPVQQVIREIIPDRSASKSS